MEADERNERNKPKHSCHHCIFFSPKYVPHRTVQSHVQKEKKNANSRYSTVPNIEIELRYRAVRYIVMLGYSEEQVKLVSQQFLGIQFNPNKRYRISKL
jgi:hypothetical protein